LGNRGQDAQQVLHGGAAANDGPGPGGAGEPPLQLLQGRKILDDVESAQKLAALI